MMPIVFEEVTGEIVPSREAPGPESPAPAGNAGGGNATAQVVRDMLRLMQERARRQHTD
jgi:hypothetical protein